MTHYFKGFSFFQKQLLLSISINIFSLAVVSGFLYTKVINEYRQNLVDLMKSKVTIISSTTASSLLFDDEQAASTILSSLSESPITRYVQIYRLDMTLFAQYKREDKIAIYAFNQVNVGESFVDNNIYVRSPIMSYGEHIGHIVISADTKILQVQKKQYAKIVFIIFCCSSFLAYILTWRLQRKLMLPIRRAVKLVSFVAQGRQYDRRITVESSDELGILCNGINIMLDTIEAHENQQLKNTEKLENLVDLRTEQLFQRANYDALTQLPNRHLLADRLMHAIDHADRVGECMALMFLDLDRFKVINDSLGHSVGDQLLVKVAEILRDLVRKEDSVCRWGGDEFVILLEHIHTTDGIKNKAKKIIEKISNPIEIQGHQLHISTSIGIARYPQDGKDAVSLLKNADISMYRAKDTGQGVFCFYQSEMLDGTAHRIAMENEVRKAVKEELFHLVYQPQVVAVSGKLCGIEALIRWKKGNHVIPPCDFLPIVEVIGLMNQLTSWVVREACRQNKAWQREGLDIVPIAVNIPVSFILLPQSAEEIYQTLDLADLDPRYFEIEITEDSFVSSANKTIQTLKSLKEMGVRISIDDFGTGYSCMSYLRDLPISTIKIDGSFVQALGESEANDGIVKAIIMLGKSLGLHLVGEAAETEYQVNMLNKLGCDIIQGYYFSKPLDAALMREYLKASK